MGKTRTVLACSACGQQLARWAGRCPGCGAWGTVGEAPPAPGHGPLLTLSSLADAPDGGPEDRIATGLDGVDRVLGGGLVPASVVLIAGEPGIGKSTLLLQMVARLSGAGLPCLLVSGEESRGQVAGRARRLGLDLGDLAFAPGRELDAVLAAARSARPRVLAVDSIQTLRDPDGPQLPGGPSQVRTCADALVGLAKGEGVVVLMTGHVTKDGDVAGPRTLEHAVDVVLTFDGEPRSGQRVLASGKNRFGQEGEAAWFEMEPGGLREVEPSFTVPGDEPGAAIALPLAGRRALTIEVQALVVPTEGPARRHATGLDPRRFQLVAAVLDRTAGLGLSRVELYGAASGGVRLDDPAGDLAVAAALASAATGAPPPTASAFVGEVALTGRVRAAPGMARRLEAARRGGVGTVFGPPGARGGPDVRVVPVSHLREALRWAHAAGSLAS